MRIIEFIIIFVLLFIIFVSSKTQRATITTEEKKRTSLNVRAHARLVAAF